MEIQTLLKATLVSILLTTASITALAGGAGDGGGNEVEGKFVSMAKELYEKLSKDIIPVERILGINLSLFNESILKTGVHCINDLNQLNKVRGLKKAAFYTSANNRINLDCERFDEMRKNGELGPVVIFHEYMRANSDEGDEYKYSSRIPEALKFLGISDIYIESLIPDNVNNFEFEIVRINCRSPIVLDTEEYDQDQDNVKYQKLQCELLDRNGKSHFNYIEQRYYQSYWGSCGFFSRSNNCRVYTSLSEKRLAIGLKLLNGIDTEMEWIEKSRFSNQAIAKLFREVSLDAPIKIIADLETGKILKIKTGKNLLLTQ